jgi:hypothetical protein
MTRFARILIRLEAHDAPPVHKLDRVLPNWRGHSGKRLSRLITFVILSGAVLQVACSTNKDLKVAQYELNQRVEYLAGLENLAERTPDVQRAILNEEERIITLKANIYRQTGDDNSDKVLGSGPFNAYLVIARRRPLSEIFDVPQGQQPPLLIDDRIRALPGVISVKLLRRTPQDSSGTTPHRDPLGILNDNPALQNCLKAANPNDPAGPYKEDEAQARQRNDCIAKFAK